jgi:two-component system NtrC family sensor kinase
MEASHQKQWAPSDQERDFPYFRRLWKSIVVALLAASFIPMLLIGGGMYYYTASIIRERTLEGLQQEVGEHREAIDEFLADRIMDLKLLASNLGLQLTSPGTLEKAFQSLQEQIPCFTDLGIIDHEGRHLAYVGPYDLMAMNYRDADWFRAMRESDVHVSDVFTGFRKEPHSIIAVKQVTGQGFWIIRGTVDAAYFQGLVTRLLNHRSGDIFLVNREGVFQTTPRGGGALMGQSPFRDLQPFPDVKLEETGQQILSMSWLQRAPWMIIGRFNAKEVYRPLRNTRHLALYAFLLGGMIIVGTVLLTTNYLIMRLEKKRRSIRVLDQQLQHSSKIASSVRLASGIIQEMNDTLSNIELVSSWLYDLSRRNLTKEENLTEMRESLGQIKQEVARARKTTEKFVKATSRNVPLIKEVKINDLLDEVLELLERELHFNRIDLHRDYQESVPLIRSDPSLLRQVFQNLFLNAVTAIRRQGRITITTRGDEQGVTVHVADTGPGIPQEMKEKIFDPLYAARPDGTGLGLSIGAGIVRKLGGRISVESEKGKGSVFTVELPSRFQPEQK